MCVERRIPDVTDHQTVHAREHGRFKRHEIVSLEFFERMLYLWHVHMRVDGRTAVTREMFSS